MSYRRAWCPGGTYFFTVNLQKRRNNALLIEQIDRLRASVRAVKRRHPFIIHAWVVLPDHLHCIWQLPEGDEDFASRWRLIKLQFSRGVPHDDMDSASRRSRGERCIWQRRYWEHLIRDDEDFTAHMDYIHINPVKHGLVKRVADWPYSTFLRLVAQGVYPLDWAGNGADLPYLD
ncbi:MAG: transposase [Paludibacterium sp.]|uniref:REP-associated tyrosine transposase n=1 Tax=Paludibacterium sp. TaxID=1917523 RepID=UPI0025FBAA95|nr:transposase [Paludibacterium sp.]MBV8049182.1 transposase [Paludibacterium sp.]MBV8646197.1 transposase [Paludibacterium sp.]